MEQSDIIIFCTPTYVFHVPGQMKMLLDDFAYRWMIHHPDLLFMKKQAVIINTAGGSGMKSTGMKKDMSVENRGSKKVVFYGKIKM